MHLDELMPDFDATRIEHRVVEGGGEAVYKAVRRADFMNTWREKRAARALMGMRVEVERLAARVRGTDFREVEEPESMRLADLPAQGEWVLLAEDPPHEIVFGVVGRFWAGETIWRDSDFSLRPYGEHCTLVSYEARTKATDPESRAAFLRYWRLVSPMAGVVLRAQLSEVAEEAGRA